MCNVADFKESDLIKSPIWPGVGPFTDQGDNQYSDQAQNRLKLTVADTKVTAAQLALSNQPASQTFLHLQMSVDFLLEALGARAQKISDFNKQLEQSKDQIGRSSAPINLNAGNYIVAIQQPDKSNYLITVNNRQTNKKVVSDLQSQPSTTVSSTQSDIGGWNDIAGSNNSAPLRPSIASTAASKSAATASGNQQPATASTSPAGQDMMKDLFLELIKRWQQIKKVAVRQRQSADLAQVLSGSALTRQSNSIKWLSTNNKVYDITPRTLQVDRYIALEPGRKYAVYVKIKELSKLMDATTNAVVKESEDSYNVNYTIEKIGDQWFISDSAVISASAQTQKPATAPRR